jgi:transcription-repair coupling factor (superfamily II helicase)
MIENEEDKNDIIDELIDRFGDIPKPTLDLLTVSLVRSAALRCDILNVVEEVSDVRIYPSKLDYDVWAVLSYSTKFKNRVRMIGTGNPCVVIKKKSGEDVLELLMSLFCDYERVLAELEAESN